jgi:hypothetical protein
MITMLLGGLWHGAAWTFVLWGFYQGLLLIAHNAASSLGSWRPGRSDASIARRVGEWAVMFHLTCVGWLIFRAPSMTRLIDMGRALLVDFDASALDVTGLLVPTVLFVTPLVIIHALEARFNDTLVVRRLPLLVRYSVYSATFFLLMLFGNFGGSDFIYFQF